MASFPNTIKPIVSGYGFNSSNNIRSIDVAGGAPIYVREFKYGPVTLSINIIGNRLTKMVMSDFIYGQINAGADAFTMDLDSGMGIEEHTVKIIPGSIQFNGQADPTWTISFNVIAEMTPAQDAPFDGSLSMMVGVYGEEGMFDILDAFGVFTLDDLPTYFGV